MVTLHFYYSFLFLVFVSYGFLAYFCIIIASEHILTLMLPYDINRCTENRIRKDYIMSESEMNSYRLTSMEEPGDERMAQIMREVAEDARESTRRAAERVAAGIEAAAHEARARVEETLNRLRNGGK